MSSVPHWLRPFLLAVLLAGLVWSRISAPFACLLLLAPLLGLVDSRARRFLVAVGYSIGCLPALVPTLAAVLGDAPWRTAGVAALWVFLTAAPWLLARGRTTLGLVAAGFVALTLTALPPLGTLDPFGPLVGATAWSRGLGAWGLAAYALLFSFLLALSERPRSLLLRLSVGVLTASLLIGSGARSPHATASSLALGFSGSFGPEPQNLLSQKRRVRLLARLLARARTRHPTARVYVFPEFFLGRFDRGVARWLEPLARALARRGDEVIAGAAVPLARRASRVLWTDGAVAFGTVRVLLVTRQPAPLAEWHPWRSGSFPAYWWPWSTPVSGVKLGGFALPASHGGGRRVVVAVCYAQTLAWTWLWNMLEGPPILVAAPESFLWTQDRRPRRLEARLARAWGRLFAIPVILARALPPSARNRRGARAAPREKIVPTPRPAIGAGHATSGRHRDVDQVRGPTISTGHHARHPFVDELQKFPNAFNRRGTDPEAAAATQMELVGAEEGLKTHGIQRPSQGRPRGAVKETGLKPPRAPGLPPGHRLHGPLSGARRATDDVAIDTPDRARTKSGKETLDERRPGPERAQTLGLAQNGKADTGFGLAVKMGRHGQRAPWQG